MPDSLCVPNPKLPPLRSQSDPGTDRNRSFQPFRRRGEAWAAGAEDIIRSVKDRPRGNADAPNPQTVDGNYEDASRWPSSSLQLLARQHSNLSRDSVTKGLAHAEQAVATAAGPSTYYRSTSADIVVSFSRPESRRYPVLNSRGTISTLETTPLMADQGLREQITERPSCSCTRTESPSNVSPEDVAAQQIEAHLANEDPISNARSRKASHYLGLFKENFLPREHDKKDDSHKARSPSLSDQPEQANTVVDMLEPSKVVRESNGELSTVSRDADPTEEARRSDKPLQFESQNDAFKSWYRDADGIRPQAMEGARVTTADPPFKESIEWRSSTPIGGSLPIRLLEEIRERKKADVPHKEPKNIKASRQKDDIREMDVDQLLDDVAGKALAPGLRERLSKGPKGSGDDTEYESDKEQISTATYFPHRGPRKADVTPRSPLRDRPTDILPSPSHSLPKLHKETEQKVHSAERIGYQPPEKRGDGPSSPTFSVGPETASATEPKLTKKVLSRTRSKELHQDQSGNVAQAIPSSPVKELQRDGDQRSPLDAVVLKPYKHQVGGHTKVFSFSRQAICKELNKRENVFYEVIEHRHPDLLRFMPRYLGVLNVTYEKASKRKKAYNDGAADGTTNSISHDASTSPTTPSTKDARITTQLVPESNPRRAISRSHHFESLDDAIPQVEYANNMHMIPMNLFQPTESKWPDTLPRRTNQDQHETSTKSDKLSAVMPYVSFPGKDRTFVRPELPQSPSWGATTVNTHFKDKVLREVFSPPVVHHRKRPGRSMRELALESSRRDSNAASTTTGNNSHHRSATIGANFATSQRRYDEPDAARLERVVSSGETASRSVAPMSTEMLNSPSKHQYLGQDNERQPESRFISRRRSGGGLRRGQIDLDDHSRSEFKYYDYNDASPQPTEDAPLAFRLAHNSNHTMTPSLVTETDSTYTSSRASENRTSEAYSQHLNTAILDIIPRASSTPAQIGPTNPLQAQLQKDQRVRHFLLLEDLTANMSKPCVLDLKMGTRQYGIDASKQKQMSQRQKCRTTTSQQLGVRVCGMQVWNASNKTYVFEDKYAGRDVKAGRDFQNALTRFLYDGVSEESVARHIQRLLTKLAELEEIVQKLPGYRFYASSLLMLYEGDRSRSEKSDQVTSSTGTLPSPFDNSSSDSNLSSDIEIKLVDFANCVTSEDELSQDTPCPPKDRNGVDRGYLRGLRSLRAYLQQIWLDIQEGKWVERGEGEGMGLSMNGAGRTMDQPDGWQMDWSDLGDCSV